MRCGLLIPVLAVAFVSLCVAPQLRADGIDTFTYTEAAGSGAVVTLTWQLPASPTPDSFTLGESFTVTTDTASFIVDGSFLFGYTDTFQFLNALVGGGLTDNTPGISLLALSTTQNSQFYTGAENNPSFVPGTYQVYNAADSNTGTLVISTPEPSALFLLCAGLCAVLFVFFRRKLFV